MRTFSLFIVVTLFISTLSAAELKILKPNDRGKAFDIAATEFQKFYEKCTGISLQITTEPNTSKEEVQLAMQETIRFFELFRDLLSLHEDYSMNATLERLKTINEVNPCFEKTLIANGANGYCYSYIYEFFDGFYIPVLRSYSKTLDEFLNAGEKEKNIDVKLLNNQYAKHHSDILQRSLKELIPPPPNSKRYQKTLLSLAEMAETFLECE
ncbi:MAG: hypothetical protein LBI18_02440 [Planctomycetaceae bacterium]|nr:hypothetical protein [Planctomycetaceae bacterium]